MANEKSKCKYVGVRKRANAQTWSYRLKKTMVDGSTVEKEQGGFKTALEAHKARIKALSDLEEKGTYAEDRRKRFGEVFYEFIEKQGSARAYSTLKRYNSIYNNHLKEQFGDRFIYKITTEELETFLIEKSKPQIDKKTGKQRVYASEYLNGFWKLLKLVFDYALKAGYINRQPVLYITKDKERGVKRQEGQVIEKGMLSQLSNRFQSTNLFTAFYIAVLTGMRQSEIFGLLWSDIDLKGRTIGINKQLQYQEGMWTLTKLKTDAANRVITMNEDLYVYLTILYEKQQYEKIKHGNTYRDNHKTRVYNENGEELIKEGLLFVNIKNNGERLTSDSCKVLSRISKDEFSYHFKFHNLRHTFITNCTMKGIQAESLRKYVGHNRIATTQSYYTHESEEMKQHTVMVLNKIKVDDYVVEDLEINRVDDREGINEFGGQNGGQFRNGVYYEGK